MVNHPRAELESSQVTAICALAEMIGFFLFFFPSYSEATTPDLRPTAKPWARNYLKQPEIRDEMTRHGWCKSDTEPLRDVYTSLNSQHFTSRLEKPNRNHSRCLAHTSNCAQTVKGKYKLSHVVEGCSCRELEVDIGRVREILEGSDVGYPVLRVEGVSTDLESLQVYVETWEPGVPYVALSHVI